jgi:hypothetical protein
MKMPLSLSATLFFSLREPMESKRAFICMVPGRELEQHPIGFIQVGRGGMKPVSTKGPVDREPSGFGSSKTEKQKNKGKALLASNNNNGPVETELGEIGIEVRHRGSEQRHPSTASLCDLVAQEHVYIRGAS